MTANNTNEAQRTYALRGLSETQAQILAKALELFSRVSLGQLEYITEMARFGDITRSDGTVAPSDCLADAETHLQAVKLLLTGHHTNSSKSIGGDTIPRANAAWEVYKVIRNQLAWDRSPTGGHGVDFFDPYSPKYTDEPKVRLEVEPVEAGPLLDVGFEDTFFVAKEPEIELTKDECAALSQRMKERGLLVAPFQEVVEVSTGSDGSKEAGEYKCFVLVTLRTSAEDEDVAEDITAPESLLQAIVADVSAEVDAGREGNWEVFNVAPAD
ncbi:hypothetical protein [Burkholderia cenocepacia]|uniref:hypothetical protein n=1 Tax=Burkholderia cenocepacia TaxID=95486 RepID=UPI00076112BC|nr:hypothetical protein [Burkholderia cenocepacia]KWU19199.1 hypothetical protein AS149_13210 [Burkholderia cenocepacia]